MRRFYRHWTKRTVLSDVLLLFQYTADVVIVTVPLGVLKARAVRFDSLKFSDFPYRFLLSQLYLPKNSPPSTVSDLGFRIGYTSHLNPPFGIATCKSLAVVETLASSSSTWRSTVQNRHASFLLIQGLVQCCLSLCALPFRRQWRKWMMIAL